MQKENNKNEISDQDFIEGIRNNSQPLLERLYKLHFPMVLKFILNNNGSVDDAKDIYQESVMVLFDKIHDLDFEWSSKLKTFIYSVARRLWLKKLNSKYHQITLIRDFEENIPVQDTLLGILEKESQFKLLQVSLNTLGEPCKTLLEDFYINGLSMESLSEKFGYTNSENAKNQKYKCLMRLKKIFFQKSTKEDE